MFGKIIESKRSRVGVSQGGPLPSEVNQQFNSEVLEEGSRLANSSRISHINFGRESYFARIFDSDSDKGVNVHITLNPETHLVSKASCGCFRSNTRTYCHHIVTFVRYILRPDPETGLLRTLSEDFESSFWSTIGWFGYKHFGDSAMGFKAQINHGGEGIRINFSHRTQKDLLAFMPGERLVEEFLYEFFDIIRGDIDPTQFKRMYGRKLKDPNVPSQRRRPWSYSAAEEDLNRRGMKSGRQHYEESLWHKIAKVGFLLAGRSGGTFRFTFLEHRQDLIVEAYDESDQVILRVVPPHSHRGTILEAGEEKDVIGNDLLIHQAPLNTGYRIELTDSSSLSITPVVENPDLEAEGDEAYLDRTELENQLFGSYYFFPDWGFFRIAVNSNGLPNEYFSPQKRIEIPPEQITAFFKEHGDRLKEDPGILIDEGLLSRRTVDDYQAVVVHHVDFSHEGVSLDVAYDFGGFRVSFEEIFQARKKKKRFLVHGEKWIDTHSSAFSWMDGINDSSVQGEKGLRIGRTDYLRFLALHDMNRVEKSFSSTRIREWFEGLEKLKPPTRLPSLKAMKGKLRNYQRNGYGWLWFLYQSGFSGLLCDDMGLGKTHQVMALMSGILHRLGDRPSKIRFLVICPTTVLSHWHEKVMEFCPGLDPYVYHGTDRSFKEGFLEHTLTITSYGIALRDIEMLAEHRFELTVLDEVQAIKNKHTKTYAAVKALESVCTVGLTGTPIENSLKDLKALFDVILPGYLMSDTAFENNFRAPIEEDYDKNSERKLVRMVHPFILRRTKGQVLKELPPKIEDVRRCSLSHDQIRFYRDVVENQGIELVQTLKDPDKTVPYMHVFAVLNCLKQICNHPSLLEKDGKNYMKYASGKWDLFVELLQESLGSGQKVVIFSQYVKMLELIESYLNDNNIIFATIKGHTRKRAEAIKKFNTDPECMVFSASLRASGLGIDLTGGSVVIHYDRWWNSAREEQATDRVHRIGQRRGVQVFKLVTENTLEEKIDKIIAKKNDS